MPLLLGMVTRFWKPAVFVMLIGAGLLYREILVHERDAARKQVTVLQAESAQCKAANSQMSAAVADQNRRVLALEAAAARSTSDETARAQAAEAAVARDASRGRRQASALLKARVGTKCREAIRWGNLQGPVLGRW